mmetsp:Transcript_29418/g.57747  ORF Transcript_29418/g.57747 Transcript_29418/m.57747 type:complete len:218 (+) Transcript_29418:238-891(+)
MLPHPPLPVSTYPPAGPSVVCVYVCVCVCACVPECLFVRIIVSHIEDDGVVLRALPPSLSESTHVDAFTFTCTITHHMYSYLLLSIKNVPPPPPFHALCLQLCCSTLLPTCFSVCLNASACPSVCLYQTDRPKFWTQAHLTSGTSLMSTDGEVPSREKAGREHGEEPSLLIATGRRFTSRSKAHTLMERRGKKEEKKGFMGRKVRQYETACREDANI